MKIQQPIDSRGKFWLPENPTQKLTGDLKVAESGRVTLELNGLFGEVATAFRDISLGNVPSVGRILGQIGLGQFVTLDKCTPLSSGMTRWTFFVELAYFGVHYEQDEEPEFWKFTFSLEQFDKWLDITGIHVDSEDSLESGQIEFNRPDAIRHSITEDLSLEFGFLMSYQIPFLPNITEVTVVQNESISLVTKEPKSIEYFKSITLKLCYFWSLALDQVVSIQYVTAFANEVVQGVRGDRRPSAQVYGNLGPWTESKATVRWPSILFKYSQTEDYLPKYLANWIQSYEVLEPALNLYWAGRLDDSLPADVRFLQLVQGIEVMHRRMHPKDRIMKKSDFRKLLASIRETLAVDCPKSLFEN